MTNGKIEILEMTKIIKIKTIRGQRKDKRHLDSKERKKNG